MLLNLLLNFKLVVDEDGQQRHGQDDQGRHRDTQGQPDLIGHIGHHAVQGALQRGVDGRCHAGIMHAADGQPHDQGGPNFITKVVLFPRSEFKRDPERCYRGDNRYDNGSQEKEPIVANGSLHAHGRHPRVVHAGDTEAHNQAAQTKPPQPYLFPRSDEQRKPRSTHPDHHRKQGNRHVVGERHPHAESQHANKMHRPDANPHREGPGDQPAHSRLTLALSYPPGQHQRGKRRNDCDQERQKNQKRVVTAPVHDYRFHFRILVRVFTLLCRCPACPVFRLTRHLKPQVFILPCQRPCHVWGSLVWGVSRAYEALGIVF